MLAALLPGVLLTGACTAADTADTANDRLAERGLARASAGPTAISAEVTVAEPVLQPVPGRWPAAAFDGTRYLVVWEDFRGGRYRLYGGRITADGTALDGAGIPLLDLVPEAGLVGQYESAVASDGAGFLVVTAVAGQVHGVRVSSAGEVLDPQGFAITTTGSPVSRPSVTFDGAQYVVAWARGAAPGRLDSGIYHARVKPDGAVLDPEGVRSFSLGLGTSLVGVSFDGTNHLLSWVDRDPQTGAYAVFAARLGTDGAPIDANPFRVTAIGSFIDFSLSPLSGFDGTNHVILWTSSYENDRDYAVFEVKASRVTPQAQVLDPDAILLDTQETENTSMHRLALAAGSGRSVAAWSMDYRGEGGPDAQRIGMAQLAANGTPSAHPADEYARGLEATLVAQPAGALLLWRDGDDPYGRYTRIIGTRLGATGAPVTDGAVAPAVTVSSHDVRGVASSGDIYFVVWADTREDVESEGQALYGARIAADGTPLDGEGILLTDGPAHVADVVFDGASFLVIWTAHTGGEGDGSPFRFVRVTPAGQLRNLPVQPQLLSSPDYTMASASDGTHTLLVGQDYSSAQSVLAAVLVDQAGAAAGEVLDLVTRDQSLFAREPAASFDGTGYLVVWHDGDEVFGQRVSAAGALEGERITIVTGGGIHRATVRAGGGNHLVLWQNGTGLHVTRVSPAGQVLDPEGQLIPSASAASGASLAFDGVSFLVAWRAPAAAGGDSALDLFGAEVTPDGEVLRTFAISEEPGDEGAPYLVAGDQAQVLAAYTRVVSSTPYDTRQARARLLQPDNGPDPGADAGPGPDAGPTDPAPDAGGSPVDPPPGDGGGDCGCTVGGAQTTPVAPILILTSVLGLWLLRRRTAR